MLTHAFSLIVGAATCVFAQSYDASLGSLPQNQHFIYNGDNGNLSPYVSSSGALEEDTTVGGQSWSIAPVDFSKHPVLHASLHIESSNYVPNVGTGTREGYYLILQDLSGASIAVGLADTGFNINTIGIPDNPLTPYGFSITDTFHSFTLDINNSVGTFSVDGIVKASGITPWPAGTATGSFGGGAGASVSLSELKYLTTTNCPVNVTLSYPGPQYMQASFTPPDSSTLDDYATSCGFTSFNWQQIITTLPCPNPFKQANLAPPLPSFNYCQPLSAGSSLTAPPALYDPPPGGYSYSPINPYPFYYQFSQLSPGTCTLPEITCGPSPPFMFAYLVDPSDKTMSFLDDPADSMLPGLTQSASVPPGSFLAFQTTLVGVSLDASQNPTLITPLFTWTWNSTFNGTAGGISQTTSINLIDPESGTGGVTTTSVNGTPVSSYTLAGQVFLSSNPLNGVSVTLKGAQAESTTTGGSGNYSFSVRDQYSYTITPVLEGYSFAPANLILNSANPGGNFTATWTGSQCLLSWGPIVYADARAQVIALPVTAPPSCSWSVSPNLPFWISGYSSGVGPGNVTLNLVANSSGVVRSAEIFVNGVPTLITQSFTAQAFLDVGPGAYYFDAVNLLANKSITAGCGNNSYCPALSVTRDQMAIFLVRTLLGSDEFSYSPTAYFGDVSSTTPAFPWIQKLYELGMTAGCSLAPLNYCPSMIVTRDQMAIFLNRARYGATTSFTWNPLPFFADVSAAYYAFDWVQRLYEDSVTAGCSAAPLTYCPGNAVTRGDMAIFLMRGGFNQLLPASAPVLTAISPTNLARGTTELFTITGTNTNFQQGSTFLVFPPDSGITVNSINVVNGTTMQVSLTASSTALSQPLSIYEQTEPQEAVLPNGLIIE